MAGFTCPNCGYMTAIFGEGGGIKLAEEMQLDVLGDVPLHLSIREMSDAGAPVVVSQPDTPQVRGREGGRSCNIRGEMISYVGVACVELSLAVRGWKIVVVLPQRCLFDFCTPALYCLVATVCFAV